MVYAAGADDRCSPLMEIHSLFWLLHMKEELLVCADPSNSIPTMPAVGMPSIEISLNA